MGKNIRLFAGLFLVITFLISCNSTKWDDKKAEVISAYSSGVPELKKLTMRCRTVDFSFKHGFKSYNSKFHCINLFRKYYEGGQISEEYSVNHIGNKDGKYVLYYESGKVREKGVYSGDCGMADFCNIKKKITYYENGKINSVINYKKGMSKGNVKFIGGHLNGVSKGYNENGTLRSVTNYEMGELDGVWKEYNEKGVIIQKIFYRLNQVHGKSIRYFENTGRIWMYEKYKNGEKDGRSVEYYPDNKVKSYAEYKGGKRHGTCIYYYDNGNESSSLFYADGVLEGKQMDYYEDGKIKAETKWLHGSRVKSVYYAQDGSVTEENQNSSEEENQEDEYYENEEETDGEYDGTYDDGGEYTEENTEEQVYEDESEEQ